MLKQLTLIGPGLAGRALALRLVEAGYRVSGYDPRQGAYAAAAQLGGKVAGAAPRASASPRCRMGNHGSRRLG